MAELENAREKENESERTTKVGYILSMRGNNWGEHTEIKTGRQCLHGIFTTEHIITLDNSPSHMYPWPIRPHNKSEQW